MSDHYILSDNNELLPAPDIIEWGRWMDAAEISGVKRVGDDTIGEARVSTIFMGVDARIVPFGDVQVFETIVFLRGEIIEQIRYSTWADAFDGHDHVLKEVSAVDASAAEMSQEAISRALSSSRGGGRIEQ